MILFPRRGWQLLNSSPLRRNLVLTLTRQTLAAIVQLLLVLLIARQLGPEGNGQYALAILVPNMLTNFLNLGIAPSTVYHVSRGDFSARQAVKGNLRLGLGLALLGIVIAVPTLIFAGQFLFPRIPLPLMLLGLAAFPISLLIACLNSIFQGLEEFGAFNAITLLPPIITLVGVWIALYVFQLGSVGAVGAYFLGQVAGLLFVAWLLVKKTRDTANDSPPSAKLGYERVTVSYGWKAHLSNILAFVNYRADIFLVNFFLAPALTGVYVIAVQFAERIWIVSQAASTVLFPRLSAMHSDLEARSVLTKKAFRIVTALTGLGAICAFIALYLLLVPLFGDEYRGALGPFLWLIPGIVAGGGARVQSNSIAAAGKPEWNMYVSLMIVVVNIAGNILLIPAYGIAGAAIATSVAYILNSTIKFILIRNI